MPSRVTAPAGGEGETIALLGAFSQSIGGGLERVPLSLPLQS